MLERSREARHVASPPARPRAKVRAESSPAAREARAGCLAARQPQKPPRDTGEELLEQRSCEQAAVQEQASPMGCSPQNPACVPPVPRKAGQRFPALLFPSPAPCRGCCNTRGKKKKNEAAGRAKAELGECTPKIMAQRGNPWRRPLSGPGGGRQAPCALPCPSHGEIYSEGREMSVCQPPSMEKPRRPSPGSHVPAPCDMGTRGRGWPWAQGARAAQPQATRQWEPTAPQGFSPMKRLHQHGKNQVPAAGKPCGAGEGYL